MTEKYCSGCKEKFADGEFVAVASDGNYHRIVRDITSPLDCSTKRAMSTDGMEFRKRVHYKGSFYNLDKLNKLANLNHLTIEFNEKGNGDIVKGDLEGLTKKKFWLF